jgi:micrococcal nuclease
VLVVLALAAGAGGSRLLGDDEVSRTGAGRPQATVVRAVDGDTVVLGGLGRSRLIGVDTPEVFGRRECFGAQASAFTKRMLHGRRISYAIGTEPRDRYGRLLVYLWLADGRLFNELLVAGGYARPLAIAPNVRFAERFRRLAGEARGAALGLWSRAACSPGAAER